MELKFKKNKVCWKKSSKVSETSYSGAILNYLENISPENKRLEYQTIDDLEDLIEEHFGSTFLIRINDLKDFSKLKMDTLNNVLKKRKLGKGAYATVYPLNNSLIVKIIKNKDNFSNAKTESRIYEFLNKRVLFNKLVYSIPMVYQSYFGINDYMVIERSKSSLWDYITQTSETVSKSTNFRNNIKSAILQTVWTLAVLQKTFPGFRHNDLKLDNILIDFKAEPLFIKFNTHKFKIKGIFIKISDFDYTNIPDHITNPKVTDPDSKTFGCTPDKRDHYDLHIFLNSLWSRRKWLPPSITKWVETIVPKELLGVESEMVKLGRLICPKKSKIITPRKLLEDPFFDLFRVTKLNSPIWGI